ncbi:polyprenyl synthetase family protein [Pelotomaculum terephthalicicum JT]|uniref:polyprenyl synthetase family protein n=1 Tax=Pelotomaculum TaxID=191373 RepID=UPI0009CCAC7E|nr:MULTISPECIES: polyprenyl synthetase family protein [Pelotomaculum]MCG9967596.1 polyprenyl synthetase family protein [Pelotomaculum terephthalicicum JT]OPX91671.1 MAG: Heptaprenyl diphosphate synthase component 2 [Pelotomaculum sp. PtaB.Bin117]OPY61827.1 MAG: Heptaprenyl diphosphate synthase component 2 [Pelotomaculum sp. PtaU1.Bin065]
MLELYKGIEEDMQVVEKELQATLQVQDPFLTETSTHLFYAGGKRLRPALSLLGAKFCNFKLEDVIPLAVALELVHMATLIHDDVVDNSLIRRGVPTVNAKWGQGISTHIGTYLFAKCLVLISQYEKKKPLIPKVLSDVSVKMCEGEIRQITASFDTGQATKDYFYRVKRKTAFLITASVQLGAVACGADKNIYLPLRRYGNNIGMAFQITDDILDMVADQSKLGKPVGGDLREGIITLPVIYALEKSGEKKRLVELVRKTEKSEEEVQEAIEIIRSCGAIECSFEVVNRYLSKAKEELMALPDLPARNNLSMIADFIKVRKH